jgi:hypothetical protein
MDRLYIVVRRDLPAGVQASQCCHAEREFAHHHPELDRQWHAAGGNIVLLSCANEEELYELIGGASIKNISHAHFCEADLGGALTAAAFASSARRLLSSLPLAMREFVHGQWPTGGERTSRRHRAALSVDPSAESATRSA